MTALYGVIAGGGTSRSECALVTSDIRLAVLTVASLLGDDDPGEVVLYVHRGASVDVLLTVPPQAPVRRAVTA